MSIAKVVTKKRLCVYSGRLGVLCVREHVQIFHLYCLHFASFVSKIIINRSTTICHLTSVWAYFRHNIHSVCASHTHTFIRVCTSACALKIASMIIIVGLFVLFWFFVVVVVAVAAAVAACRICEHTRPTTTIIDHTNAQLFITY